MLSTQRLILTPLDMSDLPQLIDFEASNQNHLKQWEPELTEKDVKKRLNDWIDDCKSGRSIRFAIRLNPDAKIIGFCNFTQIFLGAFRACYLGYKIDHQHQGKGLMSEALRASIRYVFEEAGLHRIMANYMPANVRSALCLQRLGFEVEGYAKNYLQINGAWEDHILTALSLEQWQKAKSTSRQGLRKARLDDLPMIADLMRQLGYPMQRQDLERNLLKYIVDPHHQAWVAEKSECLVGCIAFATTQYFHRPGAFLRVIALVVDEKQRGKGVGRSLMDLAESYALESGCTDVELTSSMQRIASGAHDFYHSLGYRELNDSKAYFVKALDSNTL